MGLELAKVWVSVRGDTSKTVSDINRGKSKMLGAVRGIATQMSGLLGAMGFAGLGIGLVRASGAAITFEKKMIDVRANARLLGEEGASAFEKLNKLARKLGETTQFTAVEAAEALDKLVLGGLNVKEAIGALPSVLNLAASANLELAQSAKIVVDNMRKYGMEATDTGKIADFLSSAQSRAQVTAVDVAAGLQSLGSIAAAMNVPFRDTVALLTAMGRSGTEMTRAGTALAMALSRLSLQPAEVSKVLKEMNLDMQSFVKPGGAVDLIGIFRKVADSLPEDPIQRGAKAMELFGARGREILGVLNLMKKGKFVEETFKGLGDDLGRAAIVAAAKMNTFWGTLRKVRSAMGELFIAGFTPILKAIEPFVDKIRSAALSVSALWKWTLAMGSAFRNTGIGQLLIDFGKLAVLGGSVVAAMVAVTVAAKIMASTLAVSFTVALGPIGMAVGLIVALGAAIILAAGDADTFEGKMQDVFENQIPAFFETVKFAFRNLGDIAELAIVNINQAAIEQFPILEGILQDIGAQLVAMWEGAKPAFDTWLEAAKGGLKELKNLGIAVAVGIGSAFLEQTLGGDRQSIMEAGKKAFLSTFVAQEDVDAPGPFDFVKSFSDAFNEAKEDISKGFESGGGLGEGLERRRQELLDKIAWEEEEYRKRKTRKGGDVVVGDKKIEVNVGAASITGKTDDQKRFGFAEFGQHVQDTILQKENPVVKEQKKTNKKMDKLIVEVKKSRTGPQRFVLTGPESS